MSGICGILRFDGEPAQPRAIDAMQRALAHLGPDGAFSICDGPVGLGVLAMNITAEDAFDAQPLAGERGELLAADLRLDNREALAGALEIGAETLSRTPDSALLLAAYARWGEDCVDHLLGDFAFALWDARTRRLFLARDHMGQRHLFFHRGEGFFAFASEIRGVWAAPETPRTVCEAGLEETLLRRWHSRPLGRTRFEGIEHLCGGEVMTIAAEGRTERRRYWAPCAAPEHERRDDAYYVAAYRRMLEEAVACRVRRTVRPCALLLSGGFDSAAIAALSGPALGGKSLVAVSSLPSDPDDRSPTKTRSWVELCRRAMPHLDVHVAGRPAGDVFPPPDPNADGASGVSRFVNGEIYRVAASAGARLIMDGHGGDYTLNPRGYFPVARLLALGRWKAFAAEFAAQAKAERMPPWRSAWSHVVAAFVPPLARRVVVGLRTGAGIAAPREPINREFIRRLRRSSGPLADAVAPSLRRPRENLRRALRRMQNQSVLAGTFAAQHGLKFTQPFHDKRVVELALAIPEDLYFRNGRSRYLARTALADVLPADFQTRSWRNIPRIPDLLEIARAQEPKMLAEIDRLQAVPKLAMYFDFARMRRMVVQTPADRRNAWAAGRVRSGMRALAWAIHLDWLMQDNA
ncbi:MAG TPA: asparagine synthase-related protein [Caulobacteraceae bacterium]|nr:asparagine synthase-related protein [Caulobacteraceae bacterium]